MKLGIMQPYFFPYIGYFQLLNAVDEFVLYDDVTYIKQGWINRNKIMVGENKCYFTLEVLKSSSFKLINEIKVGKNRKRLSKTVEQAYKKSPYFQSVFPIIHKILSNDEENLAKFIEYSLQKLNEYLGITSKIIVSSELVNKNNELNGQEKIIHICKLMKATHYVNAIGGKKLYSRNKFSQRKIKLNFIKSKPISYQQFCTEFVPWLSIIDVMMFNSKDQISEMLNKYELI